MRTRNRRLLRAAIASGVCAAAVALGSLWLGPSGVDAGRDSPTVFARPPMIDATNRIDLATLDDEMIGVAGEIFSGVTSAYVQAETQTCFRLDISTDTHRQVGEPEHVEGCWDQRVVDEGQAYIQFGSSHGVVVGLAPLGVTDVLIGDRPLLMQDGVWRGAFSSTDPRSVVLYRDDEVVSRIDLLTAADFGVT